MFVYLDAGIEVSIQYNDGKEEKVELVTIQDSYLKGNTFLGFHKETTYEK